MSQKVESARVSNLEKWVYDHEKVAQIEKLKTKARENKKESPRSSKSPLYQKWVMVVEKASYLEKWRHDLKKSS